MWYLIYCRAKIIDVMYSHKSFSIVMDEFHKKIKEFSLIMKYCGNTLAIVESKNQEEVYEMYLKGPAWEKEISPHDKFKKHFPMQKVFQQETPKQFMLALKDIGNIYVIREHQYLKNYYELYDVIMWFVTPDNFWDLSEKYFEKKQISKMTVYHKKKIPSLIENIARLN